ncbi:WG repeat-containing protein [Hugenholtzia roseola]|uniref:WG repeat-containing protein n=1 Tax=Hugenholtzia roseola TaxID=1002 RepID=UPI00041084E1|nr:WG repeat-containing protein [Hugenholtzia roseola]
MIIYHIKNTFFICFFQKLITKFWFLFIFSFLFFATIPYFPATAQTHSAFPFKKDNLWGLISEEGEVLLKPQFQGVQSLPHHFFLLQKATEESEKFGIATEKGQILLPPLYLNVFPLDKNFVAFQTADTKHFGIISATSPTQKTESIYLKVKSLHQDWLMGLKENKWFLLDKNLQVFSKNGYDTILLVQDFLKIESSIDLKNTETATIIGQNKVQKNKITLTEKYLISLAEPSFAETPIQNLKLLNDQMVAFQIGLAWGIVLKNKTVVEPKYKNVLELYQDSLNTYFALQAPSQKWALYRAKANEKVEPLTDFGYDFLQFFVPDAENSEKSKSEKLVLACQAQNCGVLSENGKIKLPFIYQDIYNLENKLIAAQKTEGWQLLDKNTKLISNQFFDIIYDFPFKTPFTKVEAKGKQGLVDKDGSWAFEPLFDRIELRRNWLLAYQGETILAKQYEIRQNKIEITQNLSFLSEKEWLNFIGYLPQETFFTSRLVFRKQGVYRWKLDSSEKYRLFSPDGKYVLEENFDAIEISPLPKLTLARKKQNGKMVASYVIDHVKGQILAKTNCYFIDVIDFAHAQIARAHQDSLHRYNRLVRKDGQIISEIEGKKIDTLTYFYENRLAFRSQGKWGFLDTEGKIIASAQYETVESFQNGFAKVKKEGKWGYINKQGEAVIPTDYQYLSAYEPLIVMAQNKKFGLITSQNKTLIQPEYEFLALVLKSGEKSLWKARKMGKWGIIDVKNQIIVPFNFSKIDDFTESFTIVWQGNKIGVVSQKGEFLFQPQNFQTNVEAATFTKSGLIQVVIEKIEDKISKQILYKKNGYITKEGKWIVEPIYSYIQDFDKIFIEKKGVTLVEKNEKVGYINSEGKEVVSPEFDEIDPHFEQIFLAQKGVVKVRKGNLFGYLDFKGEMILSLSYEWIEDFAKIYQQRDAVTIAKKNGKFGTIDTHENQIIPFEYQAIRMDKRNDTLSFVQKNGKWGLINQFNRSILAPEYEQLRYLQVEGNALIEAVLHRKKITILDENLNLLVCLEAEQAGEVAEGKVPYAILKDQKMRWGFMQIDPQSKESKGLIAPEYQEARAFGEGLAPVKNQNFWQYINEKNEIKINLKLEDARPFRNNLAAAKQGGLWGFLNSKGEWVIKPQFSDCQDFGQLGVPDLTAVQQSKGDLLVWALLDKSGKFKTKFEYQNLSYFSENLLAVQLADKNIEKRKWGFIDVEGKIIIPFEYAEAEAFSDGFAKVRLLPKSKWSFINNKNEIILKTRYVEASNFIKGVACVDGGSLIDKSGKVIAKTNEKLSQFSNLEADIFLGKSTKGFAHYQKEGIKIYLSDKLFFDSALNFKVLENNTTQTLVSKGEKWVLKRQTPENEIVELPFSASQKEVYLAQYGAKRVQNTVGNRKIKDLGFEKRATSQWFWIDSQGHRLDGLSYDFLSVHTFNKKQYHLENNYLYGYLDLNGKWLFEPQFEARSFVGKQTLSLQTANRLIYLNLNKKSF